MNSELKAIRGTKRHCQNDACGLSFYDLGRTEIACPMCQAAFVVPVLPEPAPPRSRMGRPTTRVEPIAPTIESVPVDDPTGEANAADPADDGLLDVDVDVDEPLILDEADKAE